MTKTSKPPEEEFGPAGPRGNQSKPRTLHHEAIPETPNTPPDPRDERRPVPHDPEKDESGPQPLVPCHDTLTRARPVPEEPQGRVPGMNRACLEWAKNQGYQL